MSTDFEPVEDFSDWYTTSRVDHKGCLDPKGFSDKARRIVHGYRNYKSEGDARTKDYWKYEKQAAAEVISKKPDLPNISSGENAGFVRRIARNVVQHTPNVFIENIFDDQAVPGILARYLLKSKIIGDDEYSNNMQQHLITTARRGFTIGYDCVIPVLNQDSTGSWYMQYDSIHYRDVYPEPGAKDIRRAMDVYVRRYLTKGEVIQMIRQQPAGWDVTALRRLLTTPPVQKREKDYESRKHGAAPGTYEIITWYNSFGDHFLTFAESSNLLLRIEKNKHPNKEHPVMFFIPERDDQQSYGKSILSLTYGRQEFQDLFMNGAMKMFYRNINPPIIGYGTVNAMPNLSPGKYTEISNPNAKVEPLEVNSQSLMMFGQISQNNAANMTQLIGAADQQMAAQSTGGMMSQTPQGVEAQQQMVDITTNNYQKSMEAFFSRYCSYALTIYFQELKNTKKLTPSAETRQALINAGMDPDEFLHEARTVSEPILDEDGNEIGTAETHIPADGTGLKDGQLAVDFSKMAVLYNVQCVPGSLIELEDEKQMRILQQIFVPLSQSMPAIAQAGDPEALSNASAALQYIVKKTIELSGSHHSSELASLWTGETEYRRNSDTRIEALESALGGTSADYAEESEASASVLQQMQQQMSTLTEAVTALMSAVAPTSASLPQGGTGGQSDGTGAPVPENGA